MQLFLWDVQYIFQFEICLRNSGRIEFSVSVHLLGDIKGTFKVTKDEDSKSIV